MVKIGSVLLLTILRLSCLLQTPAHGQGDALPKCREEESKLVGETCFHFYSCPVTWYQAKSNCESNGMTLAYVSSLDQTREILNGYTIKGRVWIGASEEEKEGEFIWVASYEIATELQQLWARGEPNNKQNDDGDEDCVGIYPSFYASDGHCSYNYSYLCMEQMCPYNLNVERVSADEVTLSWKPGFNGGPPQTFTVKYQDTMTNISIVAGTVTVPRVDQTSSRSVEYSVGGLLMKTPYIMYIDASINNRRTPCTPLTVTIETTDDFIPKCKEKGSKLVGETCFQFNASPVTWYQAKLNCESNGMTLAYVNSVNQVKEIVKAHTIQNRVWIGASDAKKEGEFRWVASNEIATELSQLWSNGEPNNMQRDVGDEDCVNVFPSSYANDDLCIFNFSYLCMEQTCPYNLKVVPVSSDGVTLSWKPGFNGGLPQTFTVKYQDLMTNVSRVAGSVTVPRINQTSSTAVEFPITELSSKTPYEIQIDASIDKGKISCTSLKFTTNITAENLTVKLGVRDITLAVIMPIIGIIIVAVLGTLIRQFLFKKGTTHGILDASLDIPLNGVNDNTGYQYLELDASIETGHMGIYNQLESEETAADNNTGASSPNSQNKSPRLPPRPTTKSEDQHRDEEQRSKTTLKLPQTVNRSDAFGKDESKSTVLTLQLARSVTTSDNVEGEESEEYLMPLQLNLSRFNRSVETNFGNEFHQEDLNYDKDTNHDAENDQKNCEQTHLKQEDCGQEECEHKENMNLDSSSYSKTYMDEHQRKEGPVLNSHMEEYMHHVEAPLSTNMEHIRGACLEINNYSSIGDTYIDHVYLRFGDTISHCGQVNTQASPAAITNRHGKEQTQTSDNDLDNDDTDTADINISSLLSDSITTIDRDENSYITRIDSAVTRSDCDETEESEQCLIPLPRPHLNPNRHFFAIKTNFDDEVHKSDVPKDEAKSRGENAHYDCKSKNNDMETADTKIHSTSDDYITPIDCAENSYITPVDHDISLKNEDIYIVFDGAENTHITPLDSAVTMSHVDKPEESDQYMVPLQLPRPHINPSRHAFCKTGNNDCATAVTNIPSMLIDNTAPIGRYDDGYITPIDRDENSLKNDEDYIVFDGAGDSYITPVDRAVTRSDCVEIEESDQYLIPSQLPQPHFKPNRQKFSSKPNFENEVRKNDISKDKVEKHIENAHNACKAENNDMDTAGSNISSFSIDYITPVDLDDNSYIPPVDLDDNSYITPVDFDDNSYITPVDLDDKSYITPVDLDDNSYITQTERHEDGLSNDESYIVFEGAESSHITGIASAVTRSYCDNTGHSEQYLTPLQLPRPHFNANRPRISLENNFHKKVKTEDLPTDQAENHDYITPVDHVENSLKNDDIYIVFEGAEDSHITPVDSAVTLSYVDKTEESDQHPIPLELPRPHLNANRHTFPVESHFDNEDQKDVLHNDNAESHDIENVHNDCKSTLSEEKKFNLEPVASGISRNKVDVIRSNEGPIINAHLEEYVDQEEASLSSNIKHGSEPRLEIENYSTNEDANIGKYHVRFSKDIITFDQVNIQSTSSDFAVRHGHEETLQSDHCLGNDTVETNISSISNDYITPIDPPANSLGHEGYIVFHGAEDSPITPVDRANTGSHGDETEQSEDNMIPLQPPRPHLNPNRRKRYP